MYIDHAEEHRKKRGWKEEEEEAFGVTGLDLVQLRASNSLVSSIAGAEVDQDCNEERTYPRGYRIGGEFVQLSQAEGDEGRDRDCHESAWEGEKEKSAVEKRQK